MTKRKLKKTEIYAFDLFQAIYDDFKIQIIDDDHKNDFLVSHLEGSFELEAKSDLDKKYQKTVISCINTSEELEKILHKLNGSLNMTLRQGGNIKNIKNHINKLIDILPNQSFKMIRSELETFSNLNWLKSEKLSSLNQLYVKIASCELSKEIDSLFYYHNLKPFINLTSPFKFYVSDISPTAFNNWLNSIILELNHDLILNRANNDVMLYFTVDGFHNLNASEFLAFGDIEKLESPKLPSGYKGLIIAGVDGKENLSGFWFENGTWKIRRTNINANLYFNSIKKVEEF